jgi:hypothetical protein
VRREILLRGEQSSTAENYILSSSIEYVGYMDYPARGKFVATGFRAFMDWIAIVIVIVPVPVPVPCFFCFYFYFYFYFLFFVFYLGLFLILL